VTAPLSLLSGLCLDSAGRPVDAVAAPVLTGLLQATLALYDDLPIDGPCAAGLVSGAAPALDRGLDCAGGCAGQLWVRLVAVYPSRAFPDPDVGTTRPPVSWAVTAEVGGNVGGRPGCGGCGDPPRSAPRPLRPRPRGRHRAGHVGALRPRRRHRRRRVDRCPASNLTRRSTLWPLFV
jgi:hypothetical protein